MSIKDIILAILSGVFGIGTIFGVILIICAACYLQKNEGGTKAHETARS